MSNKLLMLGKPVDGLKFIFVHLADESGKFWPLTVGEEGYLGELEPGNYEIQLAVENKWAQPFVIDPAKKIYSFAPKIEEGGIRIFTRAAEIKPPTKHIEYPHIAYPFNTLRVMYPRQQRLVIVDYSLVSQGDPRSNTGQFWFVGQEVYDVPMYQNKKEGKPIITVPFFEGERGKVGIKAKPTTWDALVRQVNAAYAELLPTLPEYAERQPPSVLDLADLKKGFEGVVAWYHAAHNHGMAHVRYRGEIVPVGFVTRNIKSGRKTDTGFTYLMAGDRIKVGHMVPSDAVLKESLDTAAPYVMELSEAERQRALKSRTGFEMFAENIVLTRTAEGEDVPQPPGPLSLAYWEKFRRPIRQPA